MSRKVLYVSTYGGIRGGGEISLLTLLRGLDRQRYDPVLLLPEPGGLERVADEIDVPVLIVPMPGLKHPLAAAKFPVRVRRFAKLLKEKEISIVHVNATARGALYAGMAARRAGVPGIWHVRVIDSEGLLDRALFSLYTKIVTNSDAVGKKFRRFSGSELKVVTVHNAVDLDAFQPGPSDATLRREMGAGPEHVLAGVVGRLVGFKGHRYFIEAADVLVRRNPRGAESLRFVIVGDGPLRVDCKRLACKSAAADRMVFAGHRDDVPQVMNALDILVLPSTAEHFGRVVVEAMACGKPVVATRAGGVPEIVEGGVTGILVPSCDAESLSEAILTLAQDLKLRQTMGEAARTRAEQLFSAKRHAAAIQSVYDELLAVADSTRVGIERHRLPERKV